MIKYILTLFLAVSLAACNTERPLMLFLSLLTIKGMVIWAAMEQQILLRHT